MGLLADLPLVHLEFLSAIDRIERDLERIRRAQDDPVQLRRTTDRAANGATRMRRDLEQFFERERTELVPRVRRIVGGSVGELERLVAYQRRMLNALDHFIAALTDDEIREDYDREHVVVLEHLFDEFVEYYDLRCEVERQFYQTYSTILFPGGLATE